MCTCEHCGRQVRTYEFGPPSTGWNFKGIAVVKHDCAGDHKVLQYPGYLPRKD